jgi:hypothetical protein
MRLLMVMASCIIASVAHAQEIVTLDTRAGVTQSYLLIAPRNAAPQALAALFPGGAGSIRLRREGGQIKFSPNNFLVRTRDLFTEGGVAIAILDAPSDQQAAGGMSDEFRLADQHPTDIQMVVADLRKRFPGVPVFLVGTSRGTISAAALSQRFGNSVDGVVLTSTVFLASSGRRSQRGLSGFDFSSISIPVLFVHHVGDGCAVTPYYAAKRFADRHPFVSVSGGLPPQSGPCEPLSAHGYLGKEEETVQAIVNWMLKKPYRKEIE